MQIIKATLLLLALSACGRSNPTAAPPAPPPPKPDPYLAVNVRDQLDTTTAIGRTQWHLYAVLTGPYTAQNGIAYQGNTSLQDIRLNHAARCIKVGADSVGQRLFAAVALGDTTTDSLTAEATATSIITAWYNGNRTLPAGWKALFTVSTDAWNSVQYNAGHGLVRSDPIRWNWDWTGAGTTNFYERAATDTAGGCNTF